jgi:hypothetical protein
MKCRFLRLSLVASLFASGILVDVTAAEQSAAPVAVDVDPQAASPAPANARFSLRNDETGWWLLAPDGQAFFSLGVCMFNQGTDERQYDPARPSYAALRHYETGDHWAQASLQRLKTWGFTTVGGWSDYATVRRCGGNEWSLTPVLHLGSTSGAPWFDMWDEKVIRRIDEVAEKAIAPLRGDARVLGYYSDNELGWWNASLWKMTLAQPATSGQRQRLIALLRSEYADDWQALAREFVPENASSWEELERGGMLWLRPGTDGMRTTRRFLSLAAHRYYQLMRDTIRKLDPGALYLGDRYQSFYFPEVVAASRPHVDVASTNLNASWDDGTFIKAYLDTLHQLSGKPLIISEFYMAASENRSGNKNKVGGFPQVTTQKQRAAALANTLRELGRLPYVVGADWFQYYDEPPHGRRLDGEDYNFGLVDINDLPYEEVTQAFAQLEVTELKAARVSRLADATDGLPRAPARPFGDFQSMRAIKHWDRQRGFVPPATPHPLGDLYICWSPEALYLATWIIDIVETEYYRDGELPESDRASWTIRINDNEPVSMRVGGGKDPVASGPADLIKSLSGTYHNVRCITAVRIPAAELGKSALGPGDEIALDSTFTTHGGVHRIDWRGDFFLAD